MKKILVIASFFLFISQIAFAQFDDIKTYITLNQHAKAKELLDKLAKNPKIIAKPEFSIIRATVLSNLLKDSTITNVSLVRDSAITAYNDYLKMDQSKKLITDPIYMQTPYNFYANFYTESFNNYNDKKWGKSSQSFKQTFDWINFINKNKIYDIKFDTSLNLYAGMANQNDKNFEVAASYYEKIICPAFNSSEFEFVYNFLMYHYFDQKNNSAFESVKKLGKEIYPKSKYFDATELDYILEMENEKDKIIRIEEKILKEPKNYEVAQVYGKILFTSLNADSVNENSPSYKSDENKMIELFTRTAEALPEDGTSNYLIGSHYWNKSIRIKDQIDLINDSVRVINSKAKPDKAGKIPPPPKNLIVQRDSLRTLQQSYLDMALPYDLKAISPIEKNSTKGKNELQTYKHLVDQLIEIYSIKKQYAKLPADKTKFEVEEKKWDALYTKITEK